MGESANEADIHYHHCRLDPGEGRDYRVRIPGRIREVELGPRGLTKPGRSSGEDSFDHGY